MNYQPDFKFAVELDRADPLAARREDFHLPRQSNGDPEIYLCGNSLGLQPRRTAEILQQELDDWRRLGVKGHFSARHPWMPYHEFLTASTAQLVGALPAEVVNMNTLTVNLHLMMVTFYRPTAERHAILIEKGAFPSDRHAVVSQIRHHGFDPEQALIELAPRPGEKLLRMEDIAACLEREGKRIALVMLPGVQYYTGQAFAIREITRLAHAQGCVAGFDLAHAAGNLPLALHDSDADFAVWCNYKYLNGGPGAVAGCFVHERHARNTELPRFAGWWGHDKHTRFKMGPEFHAIPGAEGWQLSNPPILSLAPVLASLEIFAAAGMQALREKSVKLTGYLEYLIDARLEGKVAIVTPRDPQQRGCQLSLVIRSGDGRACFEALEAAGVTCDWREPDVIRVAPVPLYNSFMDVYRFVDVLYKTLI